MSVGTGKTKNRAGKTVGTDLSLSSLNPHLPARLTRAHSLQSGHYKNAGCPMGWRTKSIAQVQSEFDRGELKRSLGAIHLVLFGIGCIIGAGIFVRTGTAAAVYAGPAVMLSFIIAGVICALAGLFYAELASML